MPGFAPFADRELVPATFVDRPNRFLVRCRLGNGRLVRAYMPNPGRMRELLLPQVQLHLVESGTRGVAGPRRTRYTAAFVERDGAPVLLHTHLTNAVARHLIESGSVPGLSQAGVVAAEVAVERSRFDFLVRDRGTDTYLEVKSCTLFGNRVAQFPDAVTARGRRHLLELAHLGRDGIRPCVLFVIHTPAVDWFMPDYHTDLAFSQALLQVRREVRVLPVAVAWRSDFTLGPQTHPIEIPWDYLEREVADRGSYLLVLRVARARRLEIGGLGSHLFPAGYYVYVGSAMRALTARVARHLRRRKTRHWHIDYLRQAASQVEALPVRSSLRLECDLAAAVAGLLEPGPAGFGCSDCSCPVHLFYSPVDPLDRPDFHALLQSFRMQHPGQSNTL